MTGSLYRILFLRTETQPFLLDDPGAVTLGQGLRTVGAARIDDDNLLGKAHAGQAGLELRRGIERDDGNRQRLARGGHL